MRHCINCNQEKPETEFKIAHPTLPVCDLCLVWLRRNGLGPISDVTSPPPARGDAERQP